MEPPVFVKSAADVVNYLNSKTTSSQNISDERKNDQVTDVSAFSHGVESLIGFGMSTTVVGAGDVSDFDLAEVSQLAPDAFAQNWKMDIQSCNASVPENYNSTYVSIDDMKTDLINKPLKPSLVSELSKIKGGTI